jgi:MFS family permease
LNKEEYPLSVKLMSVFCASAVLVPFMGSAFNLALPQIAVRFSFNSAALAWFNTAFTIASAVFQIPFAKLGDKYGRKNIYSLGLMGMALTLFLSPFSPNAAGIISLRLISGVFAAMFFANGMAILTSAVHPKNRARALAINVACVYSALAAGPVLGGFLAEHFGWQSIFYLTGVISIAAFFAGKLWIDKQYSVDRDEKFDLAGSILFGISLVFIIYGFTTIPKPRGFAFLITGIPVLAAFIFYELRTKFPIVNIRLFTENKIFAFSNLASLINYSANMSVTFMMSLYLQFVLGFKETTAGAVLISQALLQVAASLAAGKLSDRFTPARLATTGMLCSAAGLFGLIFASTATSPVYIIAQLSLTGLGFGLFASPNTNMVMSSVNKNYYGQASAVSGTMRTVGMSFSMGIAGLILSVFLGDAKVSAAIAPAFLQAFRWVFIISFITCLAGAYCSSRR